MNKLYSFLFILIAVVSCNSAIPETKSLSTQLQSGDVIFQSTPSRQCEAVKLATKSDYSHVGIVFEEEGKWMVYEAVQPVKKTELSEWIARGENGHYVVKRLKNDASLTTATLQKMKEIAATDLGKNYDIYFNWSDEEIYCSELVWKVYDEGANIHLGELRQLKEFDLTSPQVKAIMSERYGSNIPYDEQVIAPSDLFDCELLTLVESN